jgi:hypothetical protein
MKNLIPSLAIAGLTAVSFTGSAIAVPVVTSGTVPTECAILNVEPGVLGPNRTNPNELSTKYTGGIPASVNILCNTTTSRVTIAPNVAKSVIPPGGFLEYQIRKASGSTGIYANLDTENFKQTVQPSYTTPPSGAATGSRGDILRIDTEVVAPGVFPPGTYSNVLDVTVTP